jgi:integrase
MAIPIRKVDGSKKTRIVDANQKSVDALPLNSGTWRVAGIPGLYLRCRATSKSFFVHRRVNGVLVKKTLGPLGMKDAKSEALAAWGDMRKPSTSGGQTLKQAFDDYLESNTDLAEATVKNYRSNFDEMLESWHRRAVRDIGLDREGLRVLHQRIRKNHGDARANQVRRLLSAIYNFHAGNSNDGDSLPAFPKAALPLYDIPARNWAYTDDELRAWWHATEKKKDGKVVQLGVKTLSPLKRAYWLVSLLTGARPRSVENLKWTDIDFKKKTIHFRINKGNEAYTVPMSDALHSILTAFRKSEAVPPSDWLFPGYNSTGHLINVKNEKDGVAAKYHLRHTFKTRLTALGFSNEQAKLLMGHSLNSDIGSRYISTGDEALVESLRPVVAALHQHYKGIIPGAFE